jgi:hypothetical protein
MCSIISWFGPSGCLNKAMTSTHLRLQASNSNDVFRVIGQKDALIEILVMSCAILYDLLEI